MDIPTELTVPSRFNGPPGSGHGGYACGAVASLLGTPTLVELRAPPPLESPMSVVSADEGVEVWHDETLVARARPSPPTDHQPPVTVAIETAREAATRYAGFIDHPFPTCFACGPDRRPGDGLRIFPGPVDGSGVAAAPWIPDPSLAGDDGALAPVFVWSALDCPSAFGAGGEPGDGRIAVLASLQIRQDAPVPVGEELVLLGWGTGTDGRKVYAASAIQDARGRVLAVADALWIELRTPPVGQQGVTSGLTGQSRGSR